MHYISADLFYVLFLNLLFPYNPIYACIILFHEDTLFLDLRFLVTNKIQFKSVISVLGINLTMRYFRNQSS